MTGPETIEKFLDEHPEYFEAGADGFSIRRDLRGVVDDYARALDPAEYEEIQRRVEQYREKQKEKLQSKLGELLRQRKREENHLEQIQWEMRQLEKELERIRQRIEKVEVPEHIRTPRSWYNSGYVFVALDFAGVIFLYVGIILNERLTLSYVLIGLMCIVMGFLLQRGGDSEPVSTGSAAHPVADVLNKFRQISKIKRVTLQERKRIALGKISELNGQIESNIARLNGYNR